MRTREEFKSALIAFAKRAVTVKEHCRNEEGAKMFLVLPFIGVLGYDDRNPLEVTPEHEADFAEKYKNRADYAIMVDAVPTIAVECKAIGNGKKDDRGQLKRYFNAVKSTKLGILTDGIKYEFFVDSSEPNMMDNDPFLVLDLDAVAAEQIADAAVDHLFALTKDNFDPASVGEKARQGLAYQAVFAYLSGEFANPSEDFTRFVLSAVNIKNVRKNAIDTYRGVAKAAFSDVFKSHLLNRLDIADGRPKSTATTPVTPEILPTNPDIDRIVTTEAELAIFEEIRRRLSFLAGGDLELFAHVQKVGYRDYQGKFIVFYDKERKGRLIDVIERRDGSINFIIGDGEPDAEGGNLSVFDDRLIALFKKRVKEA